MGAKGEITKDKIIKTARHLFKHQGYRNTTIDDICNSSGVKRGNLYFYFKGKENLAHAVIAGAIEREFPLLNRMMEDQSDPLAKVEAMIDGMVQYIIAKDCQGG
jgi:AcrR family transcriptional regulator